MADIWSEHIQTCIDLVRNNGGPDLVIVVSGSENDRAYWQEHVSQTVRDTFRADGLTRVISVAETTRKGNFLGTLNAWRETRRELAEQRIRPPTIALMAMVFGQGKRRSPFTQALGNRKPAFITPHWARHAETYLKMADLSNLCSNILVEHLHARGFRGLLVKWGDEAIVPGKLLDPQPARYDHFDVIRTAFKTEISEDLAREKDWIVIDRRTGLMHYQYSRQPLEALRQRIAELPQGACEVGVNLGSLAISYDVLDAAAAVLEDDLRDPRRWVDWDPYVWIALSCRDHSHWRAEIEHEERLGKTGIRELEARYPDFYDRITQLRNAVEERTGRPFTVGVLDFGEVFWTDFGLHRALRKSLESLTSDSAVGRSSRELFGLEHARDARGNIVIRSHLPAEADVRNSVIVDSVIQDQRSVIRDGVVIGGRHRRLEMPHGGSALFCAADHLAFSGPHGVAFRSIGHELSVPEYGRHTSLLLPEGVLGLRSSEEIIDYNGANYTHPILDNPFSFEEAAQRMTAMRGQDIDAAWLEIWRHWL